MPYKKKKDGNLVNEVTVGDGYPLSSNLQPLKVGGESSPIEVASAYPDGSVNAKVKITGDLEVTGSLLPSSVFFPDETGDISSVSITTDDANSKSVTSGAFSGFILGGEGIDTSISTSGVDEGYIYIAGENATVANKGIVELATTAETTTGTDTARVVTPDGLKDGYQGSANVVTTGALDSGSITSGFGNIDNGTSTLATGEITSGAVVWEEFPFNGYLMASGRGYYFRDCDVADDWRRWDAFDADMSLNYRNVWGQYVVPEDCTLKHMRGIVANSGGTEDLTINVWYCLLTNIQKDTSNTTFSKAGSDTDVSISTSLVGVQFNEDYDVDLTAGSVVIPTLKHGGAGSESYIGSLTLKFVTR